MRVTICTFQLKWRLRVYEGAAFKLKTSLQKFYFDFFFPLSLKTCTGLDWIYEYHGWFLIRSRNCLPFASTWVHPRFLMGSVLFIFLVFCDVFFGEVRVAHLFSFLCCVFGGIRVAHLFSFLCCLFLLFFFSLSCVLCTQCCQCLWIILS